VVFLGSTDFDEISIFGLSKDQTFRNFRKKRIKIRIKIFAAQKIISAAHFTNSLLILWFFYEFSHRIAGKINFAAPI
jgi:hypothetical protein